MLQYNKTLYSAIYEEIHNLENEITILKEIIANAKRDIEHINSRILQVQNKSFGYIFKPKLLELLEYLFSRKQQHQVYLDHALNSVSELEKRILTG